MQMRNRSDIIAVLLLLIAGSGIFHSCVKEMESVDTYEEVLAFNAKLDGELTKASSANRLSGEAGIIGYVYDQWPSGGDYSSLAPWSVLTNTAFSFDGDMLTSETPVKWSEIIGTGKQKLKVYAYSPADDTNMEVSYGEEGSHTLPTITYTVPDDITLQKDIVAAVAEVDAGFRKNVPLNFDHILTGLKFKAGFACTVNSITISNVAKSGTYTIGSGWSNVGETQTYTISFPEGKRVDANSMITTDADNSVVFMIPQSFNDDSAKITLSYDNGSTLETSLKGRKWEEGRMITYTLYEKDETQTDTLYFDLAAGPFSISNGRYTGSVYINGGKSVTTFTDSHKENYRYYIYQSTAAKQAIHKSST